MGVVVGREMGFVLVVARVAFAAEGAVEGGHGFAGGGGLCRGECFMAGRHVCVVVWWVGTGGCCSGGDVDCGGCFGGLT